MNWELLVGFSSSGGNELRGEWRQTRWAEDNREVWRAAGDSARIAVLHLAVVARGQGHTQRQTQTLSYTSQKATHICMQIHSRYTADSSNKEEGHADKHRNRHTHIQCITLGRTKLSYHSFITRFAPLLPPSSPLWWRLLVFARCLILVPAFLSWSRRKDRRGKGSKNLVPSTPETPLPELPRKNKNKKNIKHSIHRVWASWDSSYSVTEFTWKIWWWYKKKVQTR